MQQVELGEMNDNSVIVHRGVNKEDELYLTVPTDTAGIQKNMLIESLTER